VEDNGAGDFVVDVLLSEEFPEVGGEFEALEESGRDEVEGLGSLAGGLTGACWVEVREIEASNNRPKSWVVSDVGEKFAEDSGVGNGDLVVQGGQGCRMNPT